MDAIRYFREQKEWSQRQLAEASSYSTAEISRWESGERIPKLEHLIRLAKALDVEPADIIQYEDRVGKARFIMVQAIAAAAGAEGWAEEAFLPRDQRYAVKLTVKIPEMEEKEIRRRLIAVEVGDNHVNKKYPQGSIVVVLKFVTKIAQTLVKNKRYLIQRINEEGRFELTFRRFDIDEEGQMWLAFDTNEPALQGSIRYNKANPAIKILGRAVRGIIDD